VRRAQVTFNHGSQSLSLRRRSRSFHHARPHLIECPGHGFDEKIVLAFKVPVKAPLCQADLLHHRPDAAAVTASLAERASGHGKNLLVVLRFVFPRIPHDAQRVRPYSNNCQGQKILLTGPQQIKIQLNRPVARAFWETMQRVDLESQRTWFH
jgi:hypothetical protein